LIKAELRDLSAAIAAASVRAVDRQTRAHLADARDEIAKALDPKFAAPAAPAVTGNPFGYDEQSELFGILDCWVDYSILPYPREQ